MPAPVIVTRTEVIPVIQGAFRDGAHPTRDELLRAAAAAGARPEVAKLLNRLPGVRLAGPGELWNHLPEVPIGD